MLHSVISTLSSNAASAHMPMARDGLKQFSHTRRRNHSNLPLLYMYECIGMFLSHLTYRYFEKLIIDWNLMAFLFSEGTKAGKRRPAS